MRIPVTWSEVTIKQFVEAHRALNTSFDELEKQIYILSAITGVGKEEVEKMRSAEFVQALNTVMALWGTEPKEKMTNTFTLEGQTFTCEMIFRNYKARQYVDLCHFLKDSEAWRENMANVLAVCYTRKGEGYISEVHPERSALFYDNLTMDVAYPAFLFFSTVLNKLTANSKVFSEVAQMTVNKLKEVIAMQEKIINS